MAFLAFGIEVLFTTSNFQCCLEFRSSSRKVREDDTGGAELLKGSCVPLVTPKLSQHFPQGGPSSERSLQGREGRKVVLVSE